MIRICRSLKGFTLAEVLITLGIIGVVAAITIPSLISKVQKAQIEALVKENYSSVAQAMRMASADDAEALPVIANSTQGMKEWFNNFLAPYMKIEHVIKLLVVGINVEL